MAIFSTLFTDQLIFLESHRVRNFRLLNRQENWDYKIKKVFVCYVLFSSVFYPEINYGEIIYMGSARLSSLNKHMKIKYTKIFFIIKPSTRKTR